MIVINNLQFTYPNKPTPSLNLQHLSIPEGSLFGLLGPNGAGKTTLIRIFAGLLPCPNNAITINNVDLSQARQQNASLCAYVPQHLAFYPKLSIVENLTFFSAALGIASNERTKRIAHILQITQLEQYRSIRAGTLSGGVQRRLNIAIGLLNSPKLLFLDEPTVGIDAQSRHFILQSIKNINALGTTVIYTSHYMEEVELLCDRIAIIDHGNIVLQGTMDDLLQHKESILVKCKQSINADDIQSLRNHWPDLSQKENSLLIPIQSQADIASIAQHLISCGLDIDQFSYGAQALEEVFLDKTHRELRE